MALRQKGDTMPSRRSAVACIAVIAMAVAAPRHATAQPAPMPRLAVLEAAGEVALDMSQAEVERALRAGNMTVEIITDLPPDGLTRMILALPADDDCLPRGAHFTCPNIRVTLLNDPQRGHRVMRVEAFQPLDGTVSVADVFRQAGVALGPPLQTMMAPEPVRGGSVTVWRQRWRDGIGDGPLTEVLATQDAVEGAAFANPMQPATGVGYLRVDLDIESSFMSVRRRLQGRPDSVIRTP